MESDDQSFLRDVHNVMHIFGDKWTVPVMVALAGGPLRRSGILETVGSYGIDAEWPGRPSVLHDSILSRTLRKMVKEGLLDRHETENVFPPCVSYSLRPEAAEFLHDLRQITGWSEKNPHIVTSAQYYSYS